MNPKKERYRRIRGWILKMLAEEHPNAVELSTIHHLLDDLKYSISREECESHILYLGEKGYVKKENRKVGDMEIIMVTISPTGLDVLDGFKEEVGVDVRFEK